MAKSPVSDIDKNVGKRIQQYRKEKGFTVAQLSELVELSSQQLSRYERGINKINLDHLAKIASRLSIPLSLFLIDEEQSYHGVKSYKVAEKKEQYKLSIKELDSRLIEHIGHLSVEQKRALILFLDAIK